MAENQEKETPEPFARYLARSTAIFTDPTVNALVRKTLARARDAADIADLGIVFQGLMKRAAEEGMADKDALAAMSVAFNKKP